MIYLEHPVHNPLRMYLSRSSVFALCTDWSQSTFPNIMPKTTEADVRVGLFESRLHVFFYKHGVFQSEARICLSFSQIEPQNMLKICLT